MFRGLVISEGIWSQPEEFGQILELSDIDTSFGGSRHENVGKGFVGTLVECLKIFQFFSLYLRHF